VETKTISAKIHHIALVLSADTTLVTKTLNRNVKTTKHWT